MESIETMDIKYLLNNSKRSEAWDDSRSVCGN